MTLLGNLWLVFLISIPFIILSIAVLWFFGKLTPYAFWGFVAVMLLSPRFL